MDIFNLGQQILDLLEMVFGFWNNQISLVFALLGQSPVSFKSGGPWGVIQNLEPIFVGVGSSLVVLFFVIGFCSSSPILSTCFSLVALQAERLIKTPQRSSIAFFLYGFIL